MADLDKTLLGAAPAAARAELERRLETLAQELAAGFATEGDAGPRWIDPAELIRRVRPFLCDN